MCDCIKEIEQKVLEQFPTFNNRAVMSVSGPKVFVFSPVTATITNSDFMLKLDNQEKKKPITVNHTFCPWCGVRYIPEEDLKK